MKQQKPSFTFDGFCMMYRGPFSRKMQRVIVDKYTILSEDAVKVEYRRSVIVMERGHSSFFGCMQAARDCNGLPPLYTLDQFAASLAK